MVHLILLSRDRDTQGGPASSRTKAKNKLLQNDCTLNNNNKKKNGMFKNKIMLCIIIFSI